MDKDSESTVVRSILDAKAELYEDDRKKNDEFNQKYSELKQEQKKKRSMKAIKESIKDGNMLSNVRKEVEALLDARNKLNEKEEERSAI